MSTRNGEHAYLSIRQHMSTYVSIRQQRVVNSRRPCFLSTWNCERVGSGPLHIYSLFNEFYSLVYSLIRQAILLTILKCICCQKRNTHAGERARARSLSSLSLSLLCLSVSLSSLSLLTHVSLASLSAAFSRTNMFGEQAFTYSISFALFSLSLSLSPPLCCVHSHTCLGGGISLSLSLPSSHFSLSPSLFSFASLSSPFSRTQMFGGGISFLSLSVCLSLAASSLASLSASLCMFLSHTHVWRRHFFDALLHEIAHAVAFGDYVLLHRSSSVSIRQHTTAYVRIRDDT